MLLMVCCDKEKADITCGVDILNYSGHSVNIGGVDLMYGEVKRLGTFRSDGVDLYYPDSILNSLEIIPINNGKKIKITYDDSITIWHTYTYDEETATSICTPGKNNFFQIVNRWPWHNMPKSEVKVVYLYTVSTVDYNRAVRLSQNSDSQ